MLLVSGPLKREWMKEIISETVFEGAHYKLLKEDNMTMTLEIDVEDEEAAGQFLKDSIKKTETGKILYFSIKVI